MNSDWPAGKFVTGFPLATSVVVGVIRLGAETSFETEDDADDSLHATLCRLAGIKCEPNIQPPQQTTYPRLCLSTICRESEEVELAANISRLTTELADEYQGLMTQHLS